MNASASSIFDLRVRINLDTLSKSAPSEEVVSMSEVAVYEPKDGTGSGLLGFLEWAGTRGELPASTARSTAVSTRKVLSIEPEPDAVNILEIDPEDLFARFETLNRTKYTSGSMTVYRSRFLNAVAMYRAWLEKRSDWKTAGGWGRRTGNPRGKAAARESVTSGRKPVRRGSTAEPEQPSPELNSGSPGVSHQQGSPMVPYELPLRPGLRVRLVLPEVLTRADADRIAAFVASLAFDQADDVQGSG